MVIKRLALPGPSDQRLQTNHTVSDEEQGKAHGDCQRRTTRLLALPAPTLPLCFLLLNFKSCLYILDTIF